MREIKFRAWDKESETMVHPKGILFERYQIRKAGETVIILDHLDFTFSRSELAHIKELWQEGVNLLDIAKKLNRDENEVFLALFHLTFENRKGGKNNIALRLSQIRGE